MRSRSPSHGVWVDAEFAKFLGEFLRSLLGGFSFCNRSLGFCGGRSRLRGGFSRSTFRGGSLQDKFRWCQEWSAIRSDDGQFACVQDEPNAEPRADVAVHIRDADELVVLASPPFCM